MQARLSQNESSKGETPLFSPRVEPRKIWWRAVGPCHDVQNRSPSENGNNVEEMLLRIKKMETRS